MSSKFRRNKPGQPTVEVTVISEAKPESSRTVAFEWARIAGSVAQILMLLIVAGGYYFTVRPHFQTQLLQEKSAALELEVKVKEAELRSVQPRIEAAQSTVKALEDQRAKLQEGIESTERRLEDVSTKLEAILWNQFVASLDDRSTFRGLTSSFLSGRNNWELEPFGFEQTADLDPRRQLFDALRLVETDSSDDTRIVRFVNQARQAVISRKDELVCEELNVSLLALDHGEQYRKIQESLSRERLTFTEKGAALARREGLLSMREIDEVFALRELYSKRIRAIVNGCEEKREKIVETLRNMPAPPAAAVNAIEHN